MKKLLTVLAVLIVVTVGLGFWRGWFVLSGPNTATGSNKVDVNLAVDPDKAKADAEAVQKKTSDLAGNVTDEANDLGDEAKER